MTTENQTSKVHKLPKPTRPTGTMNLADHAKAMGLSDVVILARDENKILQLITVSPMPIEKALLLLDLAKRDILRTFA